MDHSNPHDFTVNGSDSVPTEILLRSLLKPFENWDGHVIALLVTPTPGSTAIANFDTTAWPAWIRPAIRDWLLHRGGVPLESPMMVISRKGKVSVQPAMKLATKLTATPAEHATDADETESRDTSSSKSTEPKPNDS